MLKLFRKHYMGSVSLLDRHLIGLSNFIERINILHKQQTLFIQCYNDY